MIRLEGAHVYILKPKQISLATCLYPHVFTPVVELRAFCPSKWPRQRLSGQLKVRALLLSLRSASVLGRDHPSCLNLWVLMKSSNYDPQIESPSPNSAH